MMTNSKVMSLLKKSKGNNLFLLSDFKFLIIDEVHHFGADKLKSLFFALQYNYVIGLSATPPRSDGSELLYYPHISTVEGFINIPIANKYNNNKIDVILFDTEIVMPIDKDKNGNVLFSKLEKKISINPEFNNIVVNNVLADLSEDRYILIVSNRKDQLLHIYRELVLRYKLCSDNIALIMGMFSKEVSNINLKNEKIKIIIATASIVSEGFNVKKLNTLHILSPKKDSIGQIVGRVLRKQHDITVKIYDYMFNNSIIKAQFRHKKTIYKSMGFRLMTSTGQQGNRPTQWTTVDNNGLKYR